MEQSCSYGCLGEGWCISISDSRGNRENYICSTRRRERLRAGDAPDLPDRADKNALADSII